MGSLSPGAREPFVPEMLEGANRMNFIKAKMRWVPFAENKSKPTCGVSGSDLYIGAYQSFAYIYLGKQGWVGCVAFYDDSSARTRFNVLCDTEADAQTYCEERIVEMFDNLLA
jgi:hypothetical protein